MSPPAEERESGSATAGCRLPDAGRHCPNGNSRLNTGESHPSLCVPDSLKSCFACCPPIRPAGYEHIQYRAIIARVLRENTSAFQKECNRTTPIRGFSCWALGYLDASRLLIGCLLHPAVNGGEDLRFRVGYGDKCRRESCPEAGEFLRLVPAERRLWLRLADGLDSFEYSSRLRNPLFTMLAWGADVLRLIPLREPVAGDGGKAFLAAFPFFSTGMNPRGNAYLLRRIIARKGAGPLREASFPERFEEFSREVSEEARKAAGPPREDAPYTHRLVMDRSFLDFLRLSAGLRRIHQEQAEDMKRRVDRAEASFAAGI